MDMPQRGRVRSLTVLSMKKRLILIIAAALLCLTAQQARAQRWSIGTNVVDYLNLGTLNAEAGVAVAQHFSLHAGARYNPWTFNRADEERQFQNRKRCYYGGVRYWPWHIYSGWWAGVQGQYQEYNRGGLFRRETEEGDAYGAGLSVGYTLMVHKRLNVEFGAGAWAGKTRYTTYACPYCGKVLDKGEKFFILPNDVMVSLVYIF